MKTTTQTKHIIQIRAGDLKPLVPGLGKIITARSALPVLHCVRVEPLDGKSIQLTATDLEMTLIIAVPAKTESSFAPFLVPLSDLRDQLRPAKANDVLRLSSSSKAPPLDEFPELPTFRATPVPLKNEVVTSLLRAFQCASQDSSRYILQGALLDGSGKGAKAHRIIATDGRQLFSSNSMDLPQINASVILPDHKLWQWKLLAESRPWTLRIGTEKNDSVPFRVDGPFWSVTGKTITGNYPNYRQVIPPSADFKTLLELPPEISGAMTSLIPKLPGKKLHNRPIGIHVEKGLISLLARETADQPWQFHPIGKAEASGPDIVVFTDRDYVQRALSFGLREVALIDEMSPIRFTSGGDLMIVMPLRAMDADNLKRPRDVKPIIETVAKEKVSSKKQAPSPKSRRPKPSARTPSPPDPISLVESRIAEAKQAMDAAGGSLKRVRQQREDDQVELSGFRSLFNSIKRFATGGK